MLDYRLLRVPSVFEWGDVPVVVKGSSAVEARTQAHATASAGASGGTVTTSGGKRIHTFAESGALTVFSPSLDVEYLLVAGGGGGGHNRAGGGGAGGVLTNVGGTALTRNAGTYPIVVGEGGLGGAEDLTMGANGGDTEAFGLTAVGGGGGAAFGDEVPRAGLAGGSGGGSSGGLNVAALDGGAGDAGPPRQGYDGGKGWDSGNVGGGGGGAGAAGDTATASDAGGNGGAGVANSITGDSVTYAGGGGGTTAAGGGGLGGSGGGGNGRNGTTKATDGTDGLGGGGGGGSGTGAVLGGGDGGNGVFIVSYDDPGDTESVITFSDPVQAIEIYHDELTPQVFVINGIELPIASGGWRSPVGGTPSPTVVVPGGVDFVATRLA